MEGTRHSHHLGRVASRSLDEVLALMSHELRQPLGAILAAIEVQKRTLSPERRQRAGEVIEHQVRHLGRLVETMSDVSLLGRGMTLCLERLDARGVLRDAVDLTAPLFQVRHHQLALSEQDQPVWVLADRTRLIQIFSNILNNAAGYTPENGRIAVSLIAADGIMQFRVSDNGVGIPEEWLHRIFGLFERGPNPAASTGTGVGLGVVKALAELHGGSVVVTSEGEGRGSEFLVHLPLAENRDQQMPAAGR